MDSFRILKPLLKVVSEIVRRLEWSYVILIYTEDKYGEKNSKFIKSRFQVRVILIFEELSPYIKHLYSITTLAAMVQIFTLDIQDSLNPFL